MKSKQKKPTYVYCGLCNGSKKYEEETCPGCNGAGRFIQDKAWLYCTRCRGSGLFNLEVCTKCKGFGKVWVD